MAQKTVLGWILFGNMPTLQCNVILNNIDEIKAFWEIEDITQQSELSTEDNQCMQYYEESTTRREDGRYVVKLPLSSDHQEKLGTSKPMAIAQFRNLEQKFHKHEDVARDYKAFINEYLSLNHMAESTTSQTPHCFLPHHCVIRESATTALRVVFNASAKTSTGYSLNDVMKRGPNLQQDLQALILRWRQYQFAYTADIEKIFRQIMISEDHQQYQKIIWRESPYSPLREYQLTTVTYGTKAVPFLAMRTLKQLAKDEGYKFKSNAGKVLEEDMYMDDLISGSHSLESAKQLQQDLIQLLKSEGFNLKK